MKKYEDVVKGDGIYFDSNQVNNQDLYWIVTGKNDQTKEIYLETPPEAIVKDHWTIKESEIRQIERTGKRNSGK